MAKDEAPRLLSKVAKFVRNPLKDWSELDAQDSASPDGGGAYSREVLKEMIERRQRNDFVRRREFDMLRKLRQREAAGGVDSVAPVSSFNSSNSGKSDGRALTLKKIDEIEQQMSQQWWKGRPAAADAASGAATPDAVPGAADAYSAASAAGSAAGSAPTPVGPQPLAAEHARAYAETAQASAMMVAAAAPPASLASGFPASRLVADTGIEEAAVRFAQRDDAGCETILLQTIAPGSPTADHDDSWRALFDMYRATGDVEKFEHARTRYTQRFGRLGPEWISLRAMAREMQGVAGKASAQAAASAPAGNGSDWTCPPRLKRDGIAELMRALGAAGPAWELDWRALTGIDPEAATPLSTLLAHWANTPVQLRFRGAQRLLQVLGNATPNGDRSVDTLWWELRLHVLRAMHRPDDFELAALNYCLTYEVSPPPWEDAKGTYASADVRAPGAESASSSALSIENDGAIQVPVAVPDAEPEAGHAMLAGDLEGESHSVWARLDAEMSGAEAAIISCTALLRVDFTAAGTLLNWVTERDARGERVEFVDAHRLVAAFFNVIGIADHAIVAVRAD